MFVSERRFVHGVVINLPLALMTEMSKQTFNKTVLVQFSVLSSAVHGLLRNRRLSVVGWREGPLSIPSRHRC